MDKIVLLQSGGLDSNVLAAILAQHEGVQLHHVFIDYGQNQVVSERKNAKAIVDRYGGRLHEVKIDIPWLKGATSLVSGVAVDWDEEGELNTVSSLTYVPMRNMMFVSIACSLAEHLRTPHVAMAFDGSQTLFGRPTGGTTDKHKKFVSKLQDAATHGSVLYHVGRKKFNFITPLQEATKAQIVQMGQAVDADFSISWSCYNGGQKPCQMCSACRVRAQGFYQAGVIDPIIEQYGLPEYKPEQLF